MLFYYSATGITKALAHTISERIDEPAFDIEELLKSGQFEFELKDDERLGFLIPVYFGNVPELMRKFIEQVHIKTGEHYYCYLGLTYGGDCFAAPNYLMQCLIKRGLTTTAVFGIIGIDTFIPFYKVPVGEERKKLDERHSLESSFMAEQIADRTAGTYLKRGPFPQVTSLLCGPLYRLMRKTKNFVVSEKCIGCGLCARECPMDVIGMDEETKHPKWKKDSCMLCFRCLHHCPTEAIDYGKMSVGKVRLREYEG